MSSDTKNKRVLVSGASGFVGQELCKKLNLLGYEVCKLVRKPSNSADEVAFLGLENTQVSDFENFYAIIHLAGENIASSRWTKSKKEKISKSRKDFTAEIATIVSHLKSKPTIFISASAIGIYGDRGTEELDEESSLGDGFLADVCKDWEQASSTLEKFGIHTSWLRIGMVLGKNGGALKTLLPVFKLGLGGPIGNGQQIMSWISLEDLLEAICFIMTHKLTGPFNLTSPLTVTNLEFTKALGKALKRPAIFPLPAFVAKLMLGQFAEEALLSSANVLPKRLSAAGFKFKYPQLEAALLEIC